MAFKIYNCSGTIYIFYVRRPVFTTLICIPIQTKKIMANCDYENSINTITNDQEKCKFCSLILEN